MKQKKIDLQRNITFLCFNYPKSLTFNHLIIDFICYERTFEKIANFYRVV